MGGGDACGMSSSSPSERPRPWRSCSTIFSNAPVSWLTPDVQSQVPSPGCCGVYDVTRLTGAWHRVIQLGTEDMLSFAVLVKSSDVSVPVLSRRTSC
jgi:hypothetical protein